MDYKSAVSLLLFLVATLQAFGNIIGIDDEKFKVTYNKSEPSALSASLPNNSATHLPMPSQTTISLTTHSPNTSTTTHSPSTTTHSPNTSTTTHSPSTTTHSPNTSTTTHSPNTSTTTHSPNTSTTTPSSKTTTIEPNPSPPPKPDDRSFDFPSFMGGAILMLGIISISYVVYKFYKSRSDASYRTL